MSGDYTLLLPNASCAPVQSLGFSAAAEEDGMGLVAFVLLLAFGSQDSQPSTRLAQRYYNPVSSIRRLRNTEIPSILIDREIRTSNQSYLTRWRFDRGEPLRTRIISQSVSGNNSVIIADVVTTGDYQADGRIRIYLRWEGGRIVDVRLESISFVIHEGR